MPPNDSQQAGETLLPPKLEGFIERYGLHTAAEGWIFWGWLSPAWIEDHGQTLTAVFEQGSISGAVLLGHYPRRDLRNRGSGVCLFLPTTQPHLGKLLRIELEYKKMMGSIALSDALREIPNNVLPSHAEGILKLVPQTAQVTALREALERRVVANGFVDYYGYHPPSAGWMICGWVSESWTSEERVLDNITLQFENSTAAGPASIAMFERDDLRGKGTGLILHVGIPEGEAGPLVSIQFRAGQHLADLRPASTMVLIAPGTITDHILPTILRAKAGPGRDTLRTLAQRRGYEGHDTIGRFADSFMIDFDAVVVCPGDCVMLFGWLLARPGSLRALRIRSGKSFAPVDLAGALWIARPDVIANVGAERGYDELNCGFIIRVPTQFQPLDDLHIEAEAGDGEVGYRKLPPARLSGLAAIKRILGAIDHQYADIEARYDRLFGPAVRSLNAARLAAAAVSPVEMLAMGHPPAAPLVSLVVPLYGRIDFIELQLALFSAHDIGADVEILYVLDDPPRRRDAQALAASAYARFGIPFRLLILSQNFGFAPANNIGLRAATGEYVCFMNSDVFPITPDWPARLAARLDQNPDIGVVGPLLLFEDGSIQHRGMYFRRLPMFGNWHFPQHVQKGWRIAEGGGLVRPLAITGACMMLRRSLALDVGGLNEAYAIGDFEDSDLCMTLRSRGLSPAVDLDVRMHHLERKSQATSAEPWRVNLTLYNAWTHERRWAEDLERLSVSDTGA
jgi:GT2 family glycosyltransferase